MEQFEVVFKNLEGYEFATFKSENGDLIVRIVSVMQNKTVEVADKTKYFTKVTSQDREEVRNWLQCNKAQTWQATKFLELVEEAIQKINYDYSIATLEPSVDTGIFYAKGKKIGVGFSGIQWMKMASIYAKEKGSRIAKLEELLLWYALRVVKGFWTLDEIANDSTQNGNYWNAPDASKIMEKSGARKCGGYCDGQGNTYKIVTVDGGIALVGGCYKNLGDNSTIVDVWYSKKMNQRFDYGTAVLVLTE